MDDLFRAVGVSNGAIRLGAEISSRPLALASIEAILAARPDFLIVAEDGGQGSGQGAALLRHPALLKAYPPEKRVKWPVRETVCPGPSVIDALERLADSVKDVRASLSGLTSGSFRCENITKCSNSSVSPGVP
jgi:iron complex transport system substrate-binding protein